MANHHPLGVTLQEKQHHHDQEFRKAKQKFLSGMTSYDPKAPSDRKAPKEPPAGKSITGWVNQEKRRIEAQKKADPAKRAQDMEARRKRTDLSPREKYRLEQVDQKKGKRPGQEIRNPRGMDVGHKKALYVGRPLSRLMMPVKLTNKQSTIDCLFVAGYLVEPMTLATSIWNGLETTGKRVQRSVLWP